jgi:hypothetical protein
MMGLNKTDAAKTLNMTYTKLTYHCNGKQAIMAKDAKKYIDLGIPENVVYHPAEEIRVKKPDIVGGENG